MILCSYDAASVIDRLFFEVSLQVLSQRIFFLSAIATAAVTAATCSNLLAVGRDTRYSGALYHIFQPFSRE